MQSVQMWACVGLFVLTWLWLVVLTYVIGKPSKGEKIKLAAMGLCVGALVVVAIKLM